MGTANISRRHDYEVFYLFILSKLYYILNNIVLILNNFDNILLEILRNFMISRKYIFFVSEWWKEDVQNAHSIGVRNQVMKYKQVASL